LNFIFRHEIVHHELYVKHKFKNHVIINIMPQVPKYKLPPLGLGDETLGQRLARLRKEKGLTQVELAKAIGIRQVLVSAYERERLRPNYEMIIQFALALDVSTDEFLGVKKAKKNENKLSLNIVRRVKKIEALPEPQRRAILKTVDTFLKGAEK